MKEGDQTVMYEGIKNVWFKIKQYKNENNMLIKELNQLLNNLHDKFMKELSPTPLPRTLSVKASLMQLKSELNTTNNKAFIIDRIYHYHKEIMKTEIEEKLKNLEYFVYTFYEMHQPNLTCIRELDADVQTNKELKSLFKILESYEDKTSLQNIYREYLKNKYQTDQLDIAYNGFYIEAKLREFQYDIFPTLKFHKKINKDLKREIKIIKKVIRCDFKNIKKAYSEMKEIYNIGCKDMEYFEMIKDIICNEDIEIKGLN